MGLFLKGALVGRTPLGQPKAGKAQLYAWMVQDEDGSRLEVLSSEFLGGSGELVEIPVNPRVKTRQNPQTGQNTLMDAVTLWAATPGGGGAANMEEEWSAPGQPANRTAAAQPANIAGLSAKIQDAIGDKQAQPANNGSRP